MEAFTSPPKLDRQAKAFFDPYTEHYNELTAHLVSIDEKCKFTQTFMRFAREHDPKFDITYWAGFEERMSIGVECLNQNVLYRGRSLYQDKPQLAGVEILSALSSLNHPKAPEVKQILDTWLDNIDNQLVLVEQYLNCAMNFLRDCEDFQYYQNQLSNQVAIVLQRISLLTDQGENDAANQLKNRLINTLVKPFNKHGMAPNVLCDFYRSLFDASCVDSYSREEVLELLIQAVLIK